MKPVEAEFIQRKGSPGLAALVAAVLIAAAAAWVLAVRERHTLAALEQRLLAQELQRDSGRGQAAIAVPVLPPPYESSLRQFLAQRSAIWPDVLTTLEAVRVPGVALIAVEYSSSDQRVQVELVARDHATVLRFLEALSQESERRPGRERWSLVKARLNSDGSDVRAQLVAR